MNGSWSVILNPRSGAGRGGRRWPRIAALLREAGVAFELTSTERPGHARELAGAAIDRGRLDLLAVGGDGTVHEIANAILDRGTAPVRLAVVPVGTGNDWGRTVGIPADPRSAVLAVAAGRERVVDAGEVTFRDGNEERRLYFVNVAGMGYDAVVSGHTHDLKSRGRGGPLAYAGSLLACLLRWRAVETEIETDGSSRSERVFSLAVGIGRYNGGGMMQCPGAEPDDGLLDLTVIGEIGRLAILANVRKLFDGSFVTRPEVATHRARTVRVAGALPLEVDGEPAGTGPAVFRVLPSALRVVVG